jgi:glycosyltransferase involved in cell wall biosynthesis
VSEVRVSVALCSYQGERYLEEQLDSIAHQTFPPDEIVVCDDASTDGTRRTLSAFRSKSSLPVRLYVNPERLGSTKNFERAITLCEGDLIFLSDQDDVWHREKLSTLVRVFDESPEVGAVFTDAEVVDEALTPRGYRLWEILGFGEDLQRRFATRAFDIVLNRPVVSGMTLGFRASFRDLIVPIPSDWVHDYWISLLIGSVAEVAHVPRPLVKYRQHKGQSIGVVKAPGLQKKRGLWEIVEDKRKARDGSTLLRGAHRYAEVYGRLVANMANHPCPIERLNQLEAKIRHIRARVEMRNGGRRLRLLLREALSLRYHRYSSGWRSIGVDAFLA